jgi:hypothetical protein
MAIEPSDALQAKVDDARDHAALAALPDEYKAIAQAPQITRADLAALIGVRLAGVVQHGRRREGVLITDIRRSWAAAWIISVARAGIMEPYANHTFQPESVVRRIDLAQAVSRILARLPQTGNDWLGARVTFTDMPPGHLAYAAASAAVASGAMTAAAGAFQPSKPVSGAEAIQAMEKLETLAGEAAAPGVGP